MIRLACNIPNSVVIACSGGPDSMALLSFCILGKKKVRALFVHHGTQASDAGHGLVRDFCAETGTEFISRRIEASDGTEKSWRDERQRIYRSVSQSETEIATAHHLDDAVEWWIMSSLRGMPKLMKPVRDGLIKPFLFTRKSVLVDWCVRKKVPYIVDPTNVGPHNERANLRGIMPNIVELHPGIHTTILNKMRRFDFERTHGS